MAPKAKADEQERCPRCHDGFLFTVAEHEGGTHHKCLHCDHSESRPHAEAEDSTTTNEGGE